MVEPERIHTDELAAQCLAFARERLGPASARVLADPARLVAVLSRLRHGSDREDAVLSEVHRAAAENSAVASEFVAYFLADLLALGHHCRSSALQRFLDTGDLVQSMLGDLWPELAALRFETRGSFLTYLARRMKWKAADRARGLAAGSRREDRRLALDPAEIERGDGRPSPATLCGQDEERERLALALPRLPERDRQILRLFLKGRDLAQIARELSLKHDAARMALGRAMRRARDLGRPPGK